MNADVKTLVKEVRDVFTNFKVDESAILRPTSEFMIRFYSHFLSEFQEIVADALRIPVKETNLNNELLEPEHIFRQISRIASNESLKFNLSDIYQPTFVRTKSFMRICLHFLRFSMSIIEDIELLSVDVLEMKDNTSKLMSEKQEYLEIVAKNSVKITELLQEGEELGEELKLTQKSHDEMLHKKMSNERIYEDMNKQIEILTQEIENEESMLKKEDVARKYLLEQTITESEYNNMLQMLNSLQSDLKSANEEESHIGELLSLENEVLKHLEDCRKTMPEVTDFNLEPIEKLIHSKEQANDLSKGVEKLVNNVKSLTQHVELSNDRFTRICETNQKIKASNEDAKNNFLKERELMLQNNITVRRQKEEQLKALQINLVTIKNQLMRTNCMKDKLTTLFQQEITRIFKAEQFCMEEFTKIKSDYL